MTKPYFAELKEKLCKIDYVAANAYLTKYMEGGYEEPTYQQYGDYIHTKSSAIISELIDIIKSQSEALESALIICDMVKFGAPASRKQFLATIDQTTTRLQKLREGKNEKADTSRNDEKT